MTLSVEMDSATQDFFSDVVAGLAESPRTLPCKYFYDERGSQLFDQICDLEEYYLTRTELAIMESAAAEIADQIGPGVQLVEFGSGSSVKTRILLDHLRAPFAYVPVDISRDHLLATAGKLRKRYPAIEVLPVCADFTQPFDLPTPDRIPTHTAIYFPGSTIGNFEPKAVRALLGRIAKMAGGGGGLLIGIDLIKDRAVLESAYDDSQGVTAKFNLNLLHRMNRELGGNIRVDQFDHQAHFNETHGRVEIDLVSRCDQTISLREQRFHIAKGESIRTEHSNKYTIDGFAELASTAGLELHRSWTDPDELFAVLHFAIPE